jgi:hypothetical protein
MAAALLDRLVLELKVAGQPMLEVEVGILATTR